MKTVLPWLLGASALCAAGLICYLVLRRKGPSKPQFKEEETTETKEPWPLPDRLPAAQPLSQQQELLQELMEQRKVQMLVNYREDCAKLFLNISGCIQELLAQEALPCSQESIFCQRIAVCAENESLLCRISSLKPLQEPEPIDSETESADADTLLEIIRREASKLIIPMISIPWDELMDRLLPCLEKLVKAAQSGQAQECRESLAELPKILAKYKIYPVWYQDDVVQQHPRMQWDYVQSAAFPTPALYYQAKDEYTRVGAPGCTGES